MDTALSYITVLPSNEDEVDKFKRILKRELLVSDLSMEKQLRMCRKLFDDLLNDDELNEYWDDL
jgi:hypothetical protein